MVTSGTSGAPKGVELTWAGLRASSAAVGRAFDVGRGDRWLLCLPLHYVAGLALLGRAWAAGTPVTVLDRFDVAAVAAAEASLVSLVPTMVRRRSGAGADMTVFRQVLLGGGPVRERGPNVVARYGLTETWGGVVHDGHPLAGVELLLDHGDETLVRGPIGERDDPQPDRLAELSQANPPDRIRAGSSALRPTGGRLHSGCRRRSRDYLDPMERH